MAVVLKWQLSLLVMMNNRSQMEVPILDKGIDDWGSDEQEEAYDKLQQLKKDFEGSPTKLYITGMLELFLQICLGIIILLWICDIIYPPYGK